MISTEEKLRILKVVESAVTTARTLSELYKHTEDDESLMEIWKTLWEATDLISAALRDCTRELSEPLVEVERREPEALSGTLDAEIERLQASHAKAFEAGWRTAAAWLADARRHDPEYQPLDPAGNPIGSTTAPQPESASSAPVSKVSLTCDTEPGIDAAWRLQEEAWRVMLGWPTRGEVVEAKKRGDQVVAIDIRLPDGDARDEVAK